MFDHLQEGMDNSTQQLNFCLAEGFKELAMEVRRSFDYYALQQRNEEITKLVVSGGGSKIKNLAPYFNSQFNLPVEIGTIPSRVSCSEKIRSEFESNFPNLAVAYGLALREVTSA